MGSHAEFVEVLARTPLFDGLDHTTRRQIADMADIRTRAPNEFFVREDSLVTDLFVILSGHVKLAHIAASGRQVIFRVVGPGGMFGNIDALGDVRSLVNAEAIDACTALVWSSAAISRLMRTHESIALNAVHLAVARIRELQQRYSEVTTERVEQRVARALMRLASLDLTSSAEITVDFPISRQDIADAAGTTLYTASRLLSSWESDGLIRSTRRHVVIVRPAALAKIADTRSL